MGFEAKGREKSRPFALQGCACLGLGRHHQHRPLQRLGGA